MLSPCTLGKEVGHGSWGRIQGGVHRWRLHVRRSPLVHALASQAPAIAALGRPIELSLYDIDVRRAGPHAEYARVAARQDGLGSEGGGDGSAQRDASGGRTW